MWVSPQISYNEMNAPVSNIMTIMCEPHYCHLEQDPHMLYGRSSLNIGFVKVLLPAEKQQHGGLAE
jgi:hypothetical protein